MIVVTHKVTFVSAGRARVLGQKGAGTLGGYFNLWCRFAGKNFSFNMDSVLQSKITGNIDISVRRKIQATMPMQVDIIEMKHPGAESTFVLNEEYPLMKKWIEKILSII